MMADMPPVTRCDVENCFYNTGKMCHAPAINVGGDHPLCDTFISQANHIDRQDNSAVGACHVSQCRFNEKLTCHAAGIVVAYHADHADCGTFSPRG